jgi:uncharacterized sulfatase
MAILAEIHSYPPLTIRTTASNFWGMSLIFSALMMLLRGLETYLIFTNHVLPISFRQLAFKSFFG